MHLSARILTLGAATAVTAVALTSCAGTSSEPEIDKLRIAIDSMGLNFDPFEAGGKVVAMDLMPAVYEPLVKWDRSSSTFDPWLAEEFEVSDDGLTFTFTLRDDVDFVDGEHLDAEALVTYFEDSIGDENSTLNGLIGPYEPKVEATGEYSVEMTTVQPMRFDFFYLLEEIPIVSPAVFGTTAAATEPVGTGPYIIDEVVTDVSASLVRNPDYWNPEAYPFDELEMVIFTDEVAALNALKSGQIDVAALSLQLATEAEAAGFTLHQGIGQFATLYFLDRAGVVSPPIGDVRVRQAINLAFDRETIAQTLDLGFGNPTSQAFTKGQAEYIEGADDTYGYDPERAKELLAEAGYPDGFDLTIVTGGASASFFTNSTAFEPIIEQSLGDIGITVTFEQKTDVTEWVAAVQSGEYPVLAIPHIYTNVLRFMDTNSLFSPVGIDPGIEDMNRRIEYGSVAESAAASQELGQYLLDEAWYAPFSNPPTIWASIPGVEIEVGDILGIPNLREIQLAD